MNPLMPTALHNHQKAAPQKFGLYRAIFRYFGVETMLQTARVKPVHK